jgi:hypothetical protein
VLAEDDALASVTSMTADASTVYVGAGSQGDAAIVTAARR